MSTAWVQNYLVSKSIMKKLLLFVILSLSVVQGQTFKFGDAKGLFMAVGVGPRFPIGSFSEKSNIGVGFDITFSYTDNLFLPVFLYSNIGYQHYPGKQDLYKKSDYSSFSSNVLTFSGGVRHYFPPLLENIVLLMPVLDVGAEFAYFENFHQYKLDRNKQNSVEQIGKFGFQVGAGFSMFILDVMTYYNYLKSNQYISFVLKANIPIFVSM